MAHKQSSRMLVLQSYYDRLKEIAEESEEELASQQRRRKSASEGCCLTAILFRCCDRCLHPGMPCSSIG